MKSTYQIIEAFAEKGLAYQGIEGAMPAGHNGPYLDPETPVRNTSHWAIIFLKAWEISGKEIFREGAIRCYNYLLNTDLRTKYTFVHRNKEGKDQCNGLIGPAWNIEALIEGFRQLGDEKYLSLALDLFLGHPFNHKKNAWHRVEPDGAVLSVDLAFNHQFWFFAASTPLYHLTKNEAVKQRLTLFADHIENHLSLYKSNRIVHIINFFQVRLKESIKDLLKPAYYQKKRLKEIGYHAFNTYAFALAYREMPHIAFFSSLKLKKSLSYLDSQEYKEYISSSIHGFPYNPPGFEVAFTLLTFTHLLEDKKAGIPYWINKQFELSLNKETLWMEKNTQDPKTLTARIYELTRLPDISLG